MGRLTINLDHCMDSTAISNHFIDDYMKDANDAQLKVYLYLLRMTSAHMDTSISEIADKFNHTEKDVLRALKYWEKNNLLSLQYDESKALAGVCFLPLPICSSAISSEPSEDVTAEVITKAPVKKAETLAPVVPISEVRESMNTEEPAKPSYEKPVYSTDKLREFKSNANTAELLFVVQSYIGKPLTANDMRSILFFSDTLQFSDDLIDYLIQYCVDRGKKDFKYMEAVAMNWAEAGITTPKQAEKFASKYDKSVYTIMKELGRNSTPTATEVEYINRWTKEYGFTQDIILEACERTVLATDKHRFEYAESILKNWKAENVHHKSDIQKIDELHQKRKTSKPAATNNQFNQFAQNTYDFDALLQEIRSN